MSELMDAVDVIRTKRDGGALSDAQIDWVIDAYTRGAVADEQMAALAMAIFAAGSTTSPRPHLQLNKAGCGNRRLASAANRA